MTVAHYKIWQTGAAVGIGATQSVHVGVAAIAKRNIQGQPYIVPNELVCAQLAAACRLPVPPGFLVRHDGESAFVSMNFNLDAENLPPADPAALVATHPQLAWGIVLFDILVCNDDRHTGNLSFNPATSNVQIFDHSHALFGQAGTARLQERANQLSIGGHCLAPHLTSVGGAKDWVERIGKVADFYVTELCSEAAAVGATAADAQALGQYLIDRRAHLRDLIFAHQQTFPAVADWNAWN